MRLFTLFFIMLFILGYNFYCLSYSQSTEDLLLYKVCFQYLRYPGVYLEAGALDGIRFSNSYFFESCLNWTGILIEPNPTSFNELRKARPRNLLLNVAGCKEKKKVKFIDSKLKPISGRIDKMTQKFKDKWERYIKNTQTIDVDCVPITPLISPKFNHINFFQFRCRRR